MFLLVGLLALLPVVAGCGNDPLTASLNDDEIPAYYYLQFLGPKIPAVESVIPGDGSTDVPVASEVDIAFNMSMDPATISAQDADGACTGTAQVSANDFATCIGVSVATSDNETFTVTPATALNSCDNFKVRVTTGAQSAGAVPLAADFTQPNGFDTYGDTTADWTEDTGNPIYGGPTDGTTRAYYPFVLKVGATYHLWYGDGINTRHATSLYPDFNDFTFPAPAVTGLNATGPYHPRVLYNASGWDLGTPSTHYAGPFLMYYTDGSDWNKSPRVAHSADGNTWTDIGACNGINSYPLPPSNNTTVYNLMVLYEGGTTWKGYTDNGLGIIQYYTSYNGLDWSGTAYNIAGSPYQAWENSGAQGNIAPFVIRDGGTYVLFYSSGSARNDNAFGLATSADGQTFSKDSNNPIFSIYDTGVPAWRDNRSYTSSIVQNGRLWLLYYSGKSTATGNYSIGFARRCGTLY